MLFCMLFNQFPFNGSDGQLIKDRIISSELKLPPEAVCTDELIDFLRCLLNKDPL
jgi:hypothetical protein